jgi:hypothetical protein
VAHFFYCGGMAAAIAASIRGSRGAEWVLVAQLGLGMLKGVNRATLAKAELPDVRLGSSATRGSTRCGFRWRHGCGWEFWWPRHFRFAIK